MITGREREFFAGHCACGACVLRLRLPRSRAGVSTSMPAEPEPVPVPPTTPEGRPKRPTCRSCPCLVRCGPVRKASVSDQLFSERVIVMPRVYGLTLAGTVGTCAIELGCAMDRAALLHALSSVAVSLWSRCDAIRSRRAYRLVL